MIGFILGWGIKPPVRIYEYVYKPIYPVATFDCLAYDSTNNECTIILINSSQIISFKPPLIVKIRQGNKLYLIQ